MLAASLLVVAMMIGDAQSIETPALVRPTSPSGALAKRFATLFPLDGVSSVAPPSAPAKVQTQHRPEDPRLLRQERRDVICGLTVITKSADVDPRIIMPSNDTVVPAVRRIEPDASCAPSAPRR